VPKLHKAAHFARRALGVPDAVVLRGDQVVLCRGGSVIVDAVRFEERARRALAARDGHDDCPLLDVAVYIAVTLRTAPSPDLPRAARAGEG